MNRDHAAPPLSRRSLAVVMATLLVAATSAPVLAAVGPAGRLTASGATGSSQTPLAAPAPDREPYARGHVIVGFEPGAGPLQRGVAVASVETRSVKRVSPLARDTVLVRLAPGQTVEEAITEIGASPGVAFVEPDYTLYPLAIPDDPYYTGGGHWGMYGDHTTPQNPFGSGAGEAWDAGYTGDADVYVGVIDEGIQIGHPDLAANIWTNPGETANGVDDDGNGYIDDIHGWDFLNDDASVYDGPGDDHGTHVAGTIGARGGNGIGVAGVDWQVGIIPAKFIGPHADGTYGLTTDAIQALDYLTALKRDTGLHIVATNNSWGGEEDGQALLDAIERAGDAGILFVAAAGNAGRNIDSVPSYPASYRCDRHANGTPRGWDCIVSVANIDHNGDLNGLSNRGRTSVDLGAPGTNIVSTVPDGAYANYTGTSMATPHVTGALALCASIDPALTPRQLRSILLGTTMATPSLASTTATGGRLDIGAIATRCASGEPLPLSTVRVDDLDPGFRRTGTGWHHGWFGKQGHHFWLATRAGQSQANGTWRPRLDGPGRYRIQAWIPGQSRLSSKAVYRIRTVDGWVARRLSQARHRRGWLSLGVFELGSLPVIRLSDATGEGGSQPRRLALDTLRVVPTTARLTVTASADERPSRPGDDRPSPAPVDPSPGPQSSEAPPGAPTATPAVDSGPLDPSPAAEPERPEVTPEPEAGPGGEPRADRTPERPAPRTEPPPDRDAGGPKASQAPASEDAPAPSPTAAPEAASSEG